MNKYLPPETKITGILVKSSNTIIFSRAGHDFRELSGTDYYIDGGQKKGSTVGFGFPEGAKQGVDFEFVTFELYKPGTMVKLTHMDLYNDWNKRADKLGVILADDKTVVNLETKNT